MRERTGPSLLAVFAVVALGLIVTTIASWVFPVPPQAMSAKDVVKPK